MTKKAETIVPAVIDSTDALHAKITAMKEAQKNLLPIHRNRLTKFSLKLLWQPTKCVFRLHGLPVKKQEWVY